MRVKTSLLIIAGTIALAPAASAQQTAPQSAPPAAAPSAATVSPDEVQKFAKAAVEVNKIQDDASVAAADKQKRMATVVQGSGLTPQRFNEIAQAAQADPALLQQIQAAAAPSASSNASAPATPAMPATPATPATPPAQ